MTIGISSHKVYAMQYFLIVIMYKLSLQFTVYKKKPTKLLRRMTRVTDPETGHPAGRSSQGSVISSFLNNELPRSKAQRWCHQTMNVSSLTKASGFMTKNYPRKATLQGGRQRLGWR